MKCNIAFYYQCEIAKMGHLETVGKIILKWFVPGRNEFQQNSWNMTALNHRWIQGARLHVLPLPKDQDSFAFR